MKVSTKLYLGFCLQFIVAVSLVGAVLHLQEKQRDDSVVINLAGRQRMLSQKMTKEVLLCMEGKVAPENVTRTVDVFNKTLIGLARGGEAPLNLERTKSVKLPSPTSKTVSEQLQKVESIWGPFQANTLRVLKDKDKAALEYVEKNNTVLLQEMDKAVFLMDQEASEKVQSVKKLLLAGTAVLGVLFLLTMYSIRKNVQNIFNMLDQLSRRLTSGSAKIAETGSMISSSSLQLAEGASEQAAALEETSSSLEELTSITRQNAQNAGHANSLMKDAQQVVERANASMDGLTSSMGDISKASEETSKIVKTIDEIAFQTNLLALNAAVEAARAGEAGAGFAVVADEVRNLAMRAAGAAKNTSDLIESTIQKVKNGTQVVSTTNDAFSEVASSVRKAAGLVDEISIASAEQAQGIEEINRAVAEMDQVVQRNAANAEESASASEEMDAQAKEMKSGVDELAVLIRGNKGASSPKSNAGSVGTDQPTPKSKPQAMRPQGNGKPHDRTEFGDAPGPRLASPARIIPLDEKDFNDF